eukprot:GHVU01079282.1.p1 GENE.GHVU01079282.1~~GHVU01079282.1.p1  ORF type:complete len:107 (+),score=13.11 GHVU01079282.1:522-842(+)
MTKLFWGVEIEIINSDGIEIWEIQNLYNPFQKESGGDYWVGINEKIINEAIRNNVDRIVGKITTKKLYIPISKKSKWLKEKEKAGEFEDKPSKFSGTFRIWHFRVN